jgi:hypothetical protein
VRHQARGCRRATTCAGRLGGADDRIQRTEQAHEQQCQLPFLPACLQRVVAPSCHRSPPCLRTRRKLIKDHKIEFVDLRFADMRGVQHHVTFPKFEDGKMFDGSSISGWKGINESDMVLLPDPHRLPRSVHRRSDADPDLRHPRPGDHAGLLARPARHRQARRGLPQVQRHRRPGLLRPGARILHLRQRALRQRHGPHLLRDRLGRSALELARRIRRRQHRLPPG